MQANRSPRSMYLAVGLFSIAVLLLLVGGGLIERRLDRDTGPTARASRSTTDHPLLERERRKPAVVAIAAGTAP